MYCVVVQIYDATEPYEMQQAAGVAPTVLTLGKLGYAQVNQPSRTYIITYIYISICLYYMCMRRAKKARFGEQFSSSYKYP